MCDMEFYIPNVFQIMDLDYLVTEKQAMFFSDFIRVQDLVRSVFLNLPWRCVENSLTDCKLN